MPDGRRVAVAVFARGGVERQRGIAEAARAIYDRFSAGVRSMYASLTSASTTP
jgi:beta-lactamase class A